MGTAGDRGPSQAVFTAPSSQGVLARLTWFCSPQIDRLINHGADILKPVTLRQGEKVAVGTAVDYGYFRFFQVGGEPPVRKEGECGSCAGPPAGALAPLGQSWAQGS